MRVIALVGLAALVCLTTGCTAKLKDEKTMTVEYGQEQIFTIPKVSSDRPVIVEVTSSEPIRATATDEPEGKGKKLAEQKETAKEFKLEFTQPANKEVEVTLMGNVKKCEVTVKMTSK